jgi:hypothetical protein
MLQTTLAAISNIAANQIKNGPKTTYGEAGAEMLLKSIEFEAVYEMFAHTIIAMVGQTITVKGRRTHDQ